MQAFAYRRLPGARKLIAGCRHALGLAVGFERRVPRLDAAGQPVIGADGKQIVDVVTDLPASERFFAGGDSTVRGFVLDRLGTEDTLNDQGFPDRRQRPRRAQCSSCARRIGRDWAALGSSMLATSSAVRAT